MYTATSCAATVDLDSAIEPSIGTIYARRLSRKNWTLTQNTKQLRSIINCWATNPYDSKNSTGRHIAPRFFSYLSVNPKFTLKCLRPCVSQGPSTTTRFEVPASSFPFTPWGNGRGVGGLQRPNTQSTGSPMPPCSIPHNFKTRSPIYWKLSENYLRVYRCTIC